ncbi:hypothetical protein TWF106_005616 [Orbilia oligospora]|uniref:Transcriptional coactivator p15 (PC4) C-terminal domain-containing protein n=1 Tax=Orbilia oligospora TaxID=2813651 RepID=A0A6G1LS93_ORBOL|nr:hypothetical protein TWF788_001673 [Orbilia oligospora]KAF3195452.1 hypothetical protein TWF106_005616 [Orbilia oligospora]KAF3202427.1 hypothetical protein TWF679_010821 [Orbilia oligospora]KAF3212139.1 hypothetical protein TWF191_010552 [Orbilia oligospora]KAF3227570.1 hypothetical protein TWF192_006564 [Orbilia oligospora]
MPPKQFSKFAKKPYAKKSFTKRSYNNDDDETSSKRFKSNTASSGSASTPKAPDGARHVDDEGNFYWELGGKSRRVTVSEFKGNVLVSVREYYEKDGKYFPGKKGISMSLDQFNQLIKVLPALEEAIGQKSSAGVVRPIYTTSAKHDAPQAKSKQEIDSEDDREVEGEEEEEDKMELSIQKEESEEEDEVEEKPSKKSTEKSKVKDPKKPLKPKKKKVPDSEDEDEDDEDDFVEVEEDSEEE